MTGGRLASKVVVVTGGSSGIGRAVAERVAAEGAAVVIGARRAEVGREAAAGIRAGGGRALFVATDVTVEADVAELARAAVREFGRLDGAFNNAGGGAIVNNASQAGVVGVPGMAAYVAAKHGVVGLTRAAALECADRGVRVNALVTGNVDTPLFRRLLEAPADGELDVDGMNPTGRLARPEEVAAFVAFLLGDESAFITGAALAIDGGFTAQ
jgi:NAD(P)-dependent dehydrogenase (short-subunit alcohol dehydrogenase family)